MLWDLNNNQSNSVREATAIKWLEYIVGELDK